MPWFYCETKSVNCPTWGCHHPHCFWCGGQRCSHQPNQSLSTATPQDASHR